MPRFLELTLMVLLLPILLPIACVLCLMVYLDVGKPIFFRQMRGGYRGKRFALYKFRTMINKTDGDGKLLPDAERLTRVGRLLRATSLDELPSIWNIVKGDLRLVGPRPFIADYLDLYTKEQMRRHDQVPGVTGWAQVQGRNSLSWEEKFAMDLWYVDNRSFWLDMKILFLTVRRVIARDGISADGDVTMPRFTGTKQND